MTDLYVLVVDKAWAKLYRTDAPPPAPLQLLYHQASFGGTVPGSNTDEELARGLCRLLRADRLSHKFQNLVMLASDNMLEALRRQYDGDWGDVTVGRVEDLPARYTDEDIGEHVRKLLARGKSLDDGLAVPLRSK